MITGVLLGFLLGTALRFGAHRLLGLQRQRDPVPPEAVGAVVLGLVGWLSDAPSLLALAALLVATIVTDLRYKLIPDRVTFPGTVVGLVFAAVEPETLASLLGQRGLLDPLGLDANALGGAVLGGAGAAAGFLFLEAFRRIMGKLAGMEVMGMGDSKLLMLMGAFLGPWAVLLAFLTGVLLGLPLGLLHRRFAKTPHFPFGPALALGGLVTAMHPTLMADAITAAQDWSRDLSRGAAITLQLLLLGTAIAMILRIRRKRREWTRQIEEEYEELE